MIVKLVKLVSGEDFICQITEHNDISGKITFRNPVKLGIGKDKAGRDGVGLMPYNPLLSENQPVSLERKDYIFCVDIRKEVNDLYTSEFGGIVVAKALPKSIVLGD
jgi:hypothetical protein